MRGSCVNRFQPQSVRRFTARAAAPEGGACRQLWQRFWGCAFITAVSVLPMAVQAQTVPSGQPITLTEVLEDSVGEEAWLRFRFVAPQIARDGGSVGYAQAEGDFTYLCNSVARPYLDEYALRADVVVITLMDRPVTFGTPDPEATQFIEAFRIADDTCVWDDF
mmetsp:Transcript_27766/g.51715  ORF Transcript_27766/g.51715 Transcript_27766/m.51715 type:complete len:164 (-) Transcript_27766:383-874(-)